MKIKHGNDKTEELKKKGILREKSNITEYNMKKETPMVMNEAMFYHTFMRG